MMNAGVYQYRTNEGTRIVAVLPIRNNKLRYVSLDHHMTARTIPALEAKYMRPAMRNGEVYPIARAVRMFLQSGRTFGISKSAVVTLHRIMMAGVK